jgi:hypothetical protein
MVQIPNRRRAFWSFEIEIWDLFGICNLVFGISTLFGFPAIRELGKDEYQPRLGAALCCIFVNPVRNSSRSTQRLSTGGVGRRNYSEM